MSIYGFIYHIELQNWIFIYDTICIFPTSTLYELLF